MMNPRLEKIAQRQMNPEVPLDEKLPWYPDLPKGVFQLKMDAFGKELVERTNKNFKGTMAEMPEDYQFNILHRMALTTTIYNEMRERGIWPITPLQSERLMMEGEMPARFKGWEDLALLILDGERTIDVDARQDKERYLLARNLLMNIGKYQGALELSEKFIDGNLIVVNAGLQIEKKSPWGVVPVILPGASRVYISEVLGSNYNTKKFGYGLDNGLPKKEEIGKGERNILFRDSTEFGLFLLTLDNGMELYACNEVTEFRSGGRVTLANQLDP